MLCEELNLINRRHNKRVALSLKCENRLGSGKSTSSSTINLSRTGARLLVDAHTAAEPGFELRLSSNLKLAATTVWREPVGQGQRCIVGVNFENVSDEDCWQLMSLMYRNQAG